MSRGGYSVRLFHTTTGAPYPGLNPFVKQTWTHFFNQQEIVDTIYPTYVTGLRLGKTDPFNGAYGNDPSLRNYIFHTVNWCVVCTRVSATPAQQIAQATLILEDTNSVLPDVNYGTQPQVEVKVWVSRKQFTSAAPVPSQFSDLSPAPLVASGIVPVIPPPWADNTFNTSPSLWQAMNGPWISTAATGVTGQTWTVDVTTQVQQYINASAVANGYMLMLIAATHPSTVWYDTGEPPEGNPAHQEPYGRLHSFTPSDELGLPYLANYLRITL